MKSIFKKEFNSFFSSPIGYLVIGVYLLINGLFLWVFENDFNILHAGFADLNSYFYLAPWIFLFLIPALTMHSFSDEYSSGTIELLKTKPIGSWNIIIGKFLGSMSLTIMAIAPTLIYVYSIYQLGNPAGNIELGTVFGSFVGLLFLISSYISIGLFASTLSKNQIVAFIIAISISFLFYYGFEAIVELGLFGGFDNFLSNLGMEAHFRGVGKGVIDTKDIVYFISVTVLFLFFTLFRIQEVKKYSTIAYVLIAILVLNLFTTNYYKRIDLTADKRYSLSNSTLNILENIEDIISVKIYLKGNFPAEFKRLQTETSQHLEELKARNSNIHFQFIDPSDIGQSLIEMGLEPSRLQIQENGVFSELVIFPWAVIQYQNKTEYISLLKDVFTNSQNEQLESSIQNLEYAFVNAIHKITSEKSKKIAVLNGNGELNDIYLYDFLRKLSEYYHLAKITLDSVEANPHKTFEQISEFDLAIIAKPTEKFSNEEKLVMDQFVMNGGKSIWLVDNVQAELDSLMATGESLAYPRDLGLTDLFFNYGIRINPDLISDLYSTTIPLATGNTGNQTQFSQFEWSFFPLLNSKNNHPINKNTPAVSSRFVSSIDTLKNNISKTILLQSSPRSKSIGTPSIISLNSIREQKDPANYNQGNLPIAVLLEGQFKSAFNGRTKPFEHKSFKDLGKSTKMIVISDGDLIANQTSKGEPITLGLDKWTNQLHGNKEFLLNSVNYLLDDTGLMEIRNKSIKIAFLDKQKVFLETTKWQLINILLPLLLLGVFGFVFNQKRKRKYQ